MFKLDKFNDQVIDSLLTNEELTERLFTIIQVCSNDHFVVYDYNGPMAMVMVIVIIVIK